MRQILTGALVIVSLAHADGALAKSRPQPTVAPMSQWVITLHASELRVGRSRVAQVDQATPLVVLRKQSPWLWVNGGDRGWIREDDVVPLSKAVDVFTAQIQRNPQDVDALRNRAVARRFAVSVVGGRDDGDLDWPDEKERAIADIDAVIRLSPKDARAYALRAELRKEDYEDRRKLADIDKAIQLDSTNAEYHLLRAHVLKRTPVEPSATAQDGVTSRCCCCNEDATIESLERAISLDPRLAAAHADRAENLFNRLTGEDHADVQAAYRPVLNDVNTALELDSDHMWARWFRAEVFVKFQRFDDAIGDLDFLIRNNSCPILTKSMDIYGLRGTVWEDKKDYAKALADYSESIRCEAAGGLSYSKRATILAACPDARLRNGKQALDDALRACNNKPAKAGYYDLLVLAMAYAECGDFKQAIESQTRAIDAVSRKFGEPEEGDAPGLAFKKLVEEQLELFKAGKPYRFSSAAP